MESFFVISHGDQDAVTRGTKAFSKFFSAVFRDEAVDAFTKRRRKNYTMISLVIVLFMLIGSLPFFSGSSSVFAYILLGLNAIMLVGLLFCIRQIKNARSYCEQHSEDLLGAQFTISKNGEFSVFETRFYEDRIEQLVGSQEKVRRSKEKLYENIPCVFITGELFFFQGMGWVPKESLSDKDCAMLTLFLKEKFSPDRIVGYESATRIEEELLSDAGRACPAFG